MTSHADRDRVDADAERRRKLADAVARRDRLLARATFWDQWRTTLVLPLLVAGAGVGLLLTLGLGLLVRMPERAEAFGAVIGIFATGRWISSFFDVRKLASAERRVSDLRAQLDERA
jgi:hypothetical protein